MTDVLLQIRQLLALTESPNENEARNAAMQAARLILKYSVQLTLPGTGPPLPSKSSLSYSEVINVAADVLIKSRRYGSRSPFTKKRK